MIAKRLAVSSLNLSGRRFSRIGLRWIDLEEDFVFVTAFLRLICFFLAMIGDFVKT